jgi:hypothetical protein
VNYSALLVTVSHVLLSMTAPSLALLAFHSPPWDTDHMVIAALTVKLSVASWAWGEETSTTQAAGFCCNLHSLRVAHCGIERRTKEKSPGSRSGFLN